MKKYDPSKSQSAGKWLSLSEQERIDLVVEYHENSDEPIPESNWDAHAVIHCVIENQIALEVEPVEDTLEKLIRQGLERHEAIHAIGAMMNEDIFITLQNNTPFDMTSYRRRLKKLTAKRWLNHKW